MKISATRRVVDWQETEPSSTDQADSISVGKISPPSLVNNQDQVFGRERFPWRVLDGENPPQ